MPAIILERDEDHRGYIDLNKKELRNATLQNLGADIGSPVNGLIFYRSDTHKFRVRQNGAWQDLAVIADITSGAISATIVDAKGDLIVGTAADTVARKAVGTNNWALRANSAQGDGLEWRADLAADVAFAATDRLLGRDTAGAGAGEEITVGGGIEFTGSGGIQTSAFTGNVTKTAGGTALTIANSVVTLGMMANLAANSIIGNNTGSAATPIALTTAQTKTLLAIVPGDISGFDTQVRTSRLDQMATPTANVAFGGMRITGLADGVAGSDAATVQQITAAVNAMTRKAEVDAATTAALPTVTATTTTLTANANGALAAQDGVTLAVGDSLLVKNQAAGAQNGIYTVTTVGNAGTPFVLTRRGDADTAAELTDATVFVDAGTTNVGKTYTFPTITTLGTTDATPVLTGQQATLYTADETTLTLSGTVFSVKALGIANAQVSASAAIAYSKLALSNSIVNADVATGAAIAYSKLALTNSIVNADIASAAAIAYSKLSLASSVVAADVNTTGASSGTGTVRVTRTWTAPLVGGSNSEVLTHNLGTRDVTVQLADNASPYATIEYYVERTSTNTVTVYAASGNTLAAGIRIMVTG